MLQSRPLALEFSLPPKMKLVQNWPTQHPSLGLHDPRLIPAWLKEGVEAVKLIRKHEHEEQKQKLQLQEQLAAAQAEIEELKRLLVAS